MTDRYLEPLDDGLSMRESGEYAIEKLDILRRYLYMFTTAMKDKSWAALNYVDLEAGPGKNGIRESKDIVLGSPLLALKTKYPFDNYFFVEKNPRLFGSLKQRTQSSPLYGRIKLYNSDCNDVIQDIVREIGAIDRRSTHGGGSLNLVFVDPEGLEVHWKTIEVLGRRTRSDLIINFSTSGITRNIRQLSQSTEETAIDRFLGSKDWREQYGKLSNRGDSTVVRRFVLDLYAKQLSQLKYMTTKPNGEYIVLNSTNRQLYSLFCASKSQLGINFFAEAADKFRQPQLGI